MIAYIGALPQVSMGMNTERPHNILPYSVYIASNPADSDKELKGRGLVERLFDEYGGSFSKDVNSLEFATDSALCYVRGFQENDSQVFMIAVGSSKVEGNTVPITLSHIEYESGHTSQRDPCAEI